MTFVYAILLIRYLVDARVGMQAKTLDALVCVCTLGPLRHVCTHDSSYVWLFSSRMVRGMVRMITHSLVGHITYSYDNLVLTRLARTYIYRNQIPH